MKIIRRIFCDIDNKEKQLLIEQALKQKVEPGYFRYDIDQDSAEYENIKKLKHVLQIQDDIAGTVFEKNEILQAEWLVFNGCWQGGYPQPEDPKRVVHSTYNDVCSSCGIHGKQIHNIRVKEPKLGRHKLMQLFWLNDEVFAENGFYEKVFKKLDIGFRQASNYKNDQPVHSLVQLDIPVEQMKLNLQDRRTNRCPECNNIKYLPTHVGFFPKPEKMISPIAKSTEFFGDGFVAFRRIILSNDLMQELLSSKEMKYHQFIPCR